MQLRVLLTSLEQAGLVPDAGRAGRTAADPIGSIEIGHLATDSRAAGPESLFVAVRGTEADGHVFIDKAVQNGARAIVCEVLPQETQARFPEVAFVRVRDARHAVAELAAVFYGQPARALTLAGVTGTNGKTTTTHLVRHVLEALGVKTGLMGTIAVHRGDEDAAPSALTTPGPIEVQRLLREMVDNGCAACAMEVSSHALLQERVRGVAFDAAAFTNLTPEHLDYHGTLTGYLAAKKRLFGDLPAGAGALYNADDEAGPQVVAGTAARVVSFGQSEEADLRFEVLESTLRGLRLRLDGRERQFRLVGAFNAYNLAAAYGLARALGHAAEAVLEALAEAPPVPGRFEQIAFAGGTTVIVDYAHTPDALAHVLRTARALRPQGAALWCVFGCGGDRDRAKRPAMGALAERLADHVVVTSDNPRTEDPQAILRDIREGMARPDAALFMADRRAAIQEAARRCQPGDVVLIAGKGHETTQTIGTEKHPFDDREAARQYFQDST